jgi:hypothetical protein
VGFIVQFKDRELVEKALALTGHVVIDIHEKPVKIERSHLPAAGLVPPGMHRANPKGEGKCMKRNWKRKEQGAKVKLPNNDSREPDEEPTSAIGTPSDAERAKSSSRNVLAFWPPMVQPQRGAKP